ncbi:class F sortase [Aeromicrobium duanguangcaii]|uniref:Class F sortase n=1 Tax=Aeromicrobium duanguangcaii TaxID=2968086 RepID=A0ABY5KDF1_9ACTN|nr:class F sortase [Aeromicrobium duanguangcaii]MCD9154450.1 class F sortase [Aeromicrobium duanguangcaii]UUI68492.1 class F sortase [Aeromicrobium duanguangcaii]
MKRSHSTEAPARTRRGLSVMAALALAVSTSGLVSCAVGDRTARQSESPSTASPSPLVEATPDPAEGQPSRLRIPAIDVDATVIPLTLNEGDVLEPPADFTQVGWWAEGALPGSTRGAVVLTAHTVHEGGGAFDDLGKLERGDTVTIRTAAGTVRYCVDDVAEYSQQELRENAPKIFSQTGTSRLAMVTCGWYHLGHYDSNIVVTATPIAT